MGRRRAIREARRALDAATDADGWRRAAETLDELTGLAEWRRDDANDHYHPENLRRDLERLRALRSQGPIEALLEALQDSLWRHLNDVLEPALFETAFAGPKQLVTEYLDEVEGIIEGLVYGDAPGWSDARKLEVVRGAARNLGRSALLLSGGGTLGWYHLGVIKALWGAQLLPEVVVGASMGAMIAAGICCRTPAELDTLFADEIPDVETVGLAFRGARAAIRAGSLLEPGPMLATIEKNCGRYTFAEAFARSGRVLNISLMPTRTRQKPRILNHLTAPDVWVHRAALASAAIPGLFPPVALTRKGPGGTERPYIEGETWVDGSFGADLPMARVGRLHNVNHFIVSQTQPHVLPLLAGVNQRGLGGLLVEAAVRAARTQGAQALAVSRWAASHTPLGSGLDVAHQLVSQAYRGDIDIHPRFDPSVYARVFTNATREQLGGFVSEGERATWPKLAMVRDATRISRCLSRCEASLLGRDGDLSA